MQNPTPDPEPIPPCPRCRATHVIRHGQTQSGSPNFRCRGCGRCFVERPKRRPVDDERKALVKRLLLERVSLRGIARVTGISRSWLQRFVNQLFREDTPWEPGPLKKKGGRLVLEADELWSYVKNKGDAWWIWVALDADTRQVVAMVAGDRSQYTAQCLWDALPDEYRDGALIYSDYWAAYAAVVPASQHMACGKGDGKTCHVERFWCTVRQRCSRFVRKTLSFSKCAWNNTGALWYFIHHYNAAIR